jgi:glycosylphosphatidylinositol transamidase (GPIT) subunit GPI8
MQSSKCGRNDGQLRFPRPLEVVADENRYNRLFYMIDTCQANSMYSKFYSPNIISTGSSMVGENSYSVSYRFLMLGSS